MSEDVKALIDEGQKALAAVNEAVSDEKLEQRIKGAADPLIEAKFQKANAELDAKIEAWEADKKAREERDAKLEARIAKLAEMDEKGETGENAKLKAAFVDYVRSGDESSYKAAFAELPAEQKALIARDDAQAGYLLAPDEVDANVTRIVSEFSPVRQFASVVNISSPAWKQNVNTGGSAATWEDADTDASSENANPSFREIRIPANALRAVYHASPDMLDDARVSIDQLFAQEMGIAIAELEGPAFVSGSGVGRPRGFLSYTNTVTGSYTGAWEQVEFHQTGAAGAFNGTNPDNVFIECEESLKAAYRANARYFFNKTTLAGIRKLRDADERSLFQWDASQGAAPTIHGKPYAIFEDMDNYSTDDAYAIAYGDLSRAYQIVDRAGLTVLRDPYSSKPQVEFFGRKRVGGGMKMFEALKLIRMAD